MTTKTHMVIALMAITMSISMPMAFAASFDMSVDVGVDEKSTTRTLDVSGDLTNINDQGYEEDNWFIQNVTINRDGLDIPKELTASGMLFPKLTLSGELMGFDLDLLFKDVNDNIVKDFNLSFGSLVQEGNDVTTSSDLFDTSTYEIYGDNIESKRGDDNGRLVNLQNGTLTVVGIP